MDNCALLKLKFSGVPAEDRMDADELPGYWELMKLCQGLDVIVYITYLA